MGRKVEAGKPATAPVQAGTAEQSEARRGGGNERAEVLFRKRSPRDWVTGSEQGGRRGGARGATLAGRRGQTQHAPPAQLPPCPSCCGPRSRTPRAHASGCIGLLPDAKPLARPFSLLEWSSLSLPGNTTHLS